MQQEHGYTIEVREEQNTTTFIIEFEQNDFNRVNKPELLDGVLELLNLHKDMQTNTGTVDEDIIVNQVYDDLEEIAYLSKNRLYDGFRSEWEYRMNALFDKYGIKFDGETQY